MKYFRWMVGSILLAALQVGAVHAGKDEKIVKADTKDAFDVVVAAVKQEMGPGGRFEFVEGRDRSTVTELLGDMQALFAQYGSVDGMSENVKLQLFNYQEQVNGILTRNDGNRLVCQRVAPTGSNIVRPICRTYGQLRRDAKESQEYWRDKANVPNPTSQSLPNGKNQLGN